MTPRISKALLAVCAVALLAHLPGLFAGFTLDDHALLTQNPYLRSWSGLGQLLTSEFFLASGEPRNVPYYRPLSGALYFLSYQAFGQNTVLQHGLNLVLHACTVGLFFGILCQSQVGRRTALACSVLFAVHPASPDIVVYIGGRQDMVGWIFVLGGALLIARPQKGFGAPFSIAFVSVLAAALSREFFLAAPLLLALLSLALSSNEAPLRRRLHFASVVLGGGALGSAAVLALRKALAIQAFELEGATPGAILDAAAGIGLRLLQVTLVPIDVSVDVTPWALGLLGSMLVLTLLVLLALGSLTVARRAGGNPGLLLFGWSAFFLTMLLHVPVLLKYGTMSDRYAYGAVLGLAAVLAGTLGPLRKRVQSVLRPSLFRPLLALLVLALLPLTWTRATEWHDEASLQLSMYQSRPHDPESQLAEGMRRFYAGDLDAAYPLCQRYADAKPKSDRAGLCLGTTLLLRGDARGAVQVLEPFVYGRPGQIDARVRLFQAWFLAGDLASVERGIADFGGMWPDAADVVAAREELARRSGSP